MLFYGKDVTDWDIRKINRLFRQNDDSHLWPICNEFDATERAIRRVRKLMRHNGAMAGFEYAYALDQEISLIVNNHNR